MGIKEGKNAKTSNLAVDRPVADKVREKAEQAQVSVLEMATALLAHAMSQGEVEVEPRKIKIVAKDEIETPRRGRPPKKR